MSKTVLVIAGVLLAAGTVAAISAPHFRGGHRGPLGHHGPMFGEGPDGLLGASPARFGERLKELDTNKDGVITLDEFLARRAPQFTRLDKNNDGVVDRAEFEAAAKESADYWVKRFIKRFDTDRDGRVSKEEFTKARGDRFAMRDLDDDGQIGDEDRGPGMRERFRRWMDDRRGERAERKDADREPGKDAKDGKEGPRFSMERWRGRGERAFGRLDKNGDGFIDAKDLEPAAAERAAAASKRFFRALDVDNDGKVTRDEFNARAKSRFAGLDLDDDGKITDADLPPMMRGLGILK
jgi:Ca2+-binding EF-hand superfamily protein